MSRMKKYNKGVLLVEVETLKSEKLLNYLWKKDIKLRRIKRNSLTNYTMEIEFKDYNTLLEGVKKVELPKVVFLCTIKAPLLYNLSLSISFNNIFM